MKYAIAALLNSTSIRPHSRTPDRAGADTRTFVQMARLKGDHRSALSANHFNRSFCCGDVHVATDDRRILSSEFQNNVRSAHWCDPGTGTAGTAR